MNIFQKLEHGIVHDTDAFAKWLASIESPATKTSASAAAGALQAGLSNLETVGESLVVDMANGALALVPGGLGSGFVPVVDALIEGAVAKLFAKHSNPAAAAAAVAAAVGAPAPAVTTGG